MTIAVTGSTGHLGGRIAHRLDHAGVAQRLILRDPSRAPRLRHVSDVVQASYGDHDASVEALRGVDLLLMVSAAEHPHRLQQHYDFVDAAAEAGVGHIVYTSFVGVRPDATFTLVRDHWATEERIRSTGITSTFLRDNLYADFFPLMTGEDGVLRGPAGDGRVAAVAQDDIADVATAVLRDPSAHAGAAYELTGPEALTLTEVAAIISSLSTRKVLYHNESLDEAYSSRSGYGAPDWQVEAWVSTYTAIAAGELAAVSSAVPDITGHPATSLATLLSR